MKLSKMTTNQWLLVLFTAIPAILIVVVIVATAPDMLK